MEDRRIKYHTLDTWPVFFEAVISGLKTFEVRKDDRGFKVGDCLTLIEYDPHTEKRSGRMQTFRISYKMGGGAFGLENGYCALGIEAMK